MRARLKAAFGRFVDLRGKSDPAIAAWLRQNEIDIAVDLSGHTQESRLSILAHRPAPLQVSYLGYPGTTGAPYVDYLIADRVLIPDAEREHYDEKIAFLPGTFFPTDASGGGGAPPARGAVGLPDSAFVFCCFNPLCKLNPESFAVWLNLLRGVEGSVLWLPDQDEEARQHLRDAARAAGVDGTRIVFASFAPTRDEHLARLPLADLFLDTWPYNAHATASDALWMGLPVLTLPGRSFAARVAASLLGAIGLGELVTTSVADYESQALRLARDPALLARIRARLGDNRQTAPLFDTARTAANLEAAYMQMWERWQRGEPAADFEIAAQP
jgi:predicted O-linked N-acetylglucosamine transferase (SPINDLY family)